MNERIKEFAEQAGMVRGGYANGTDIMTWRESFDNPGSLQKFAELIVLECMRMCEVTEMSFVTHDCDVEASGAITVKQFIAEHFGVEE